MKRAFISALGLALTQPSCVVVGGYSSEGGWFIWPGSLGLILLIVILLLLWRRGRR